MAVMRSESPGKRSRRRAKLVPLRVVDGEHGRQVVEGAVPAVAHEHRRALSRAEAERGPDRGREAFNLDTMLEVVDAEPLVGRGEAQPVAPVRSHARPGPPRPPPAA